MTTQKSPSVPPSPDDVAAALREHAPEILAIFGEAQRFAAGIQRRRQSRRAPSSE